MPGPEYQGIEQTNDQPHQTKVAAGAVKSLGRVGGIRRNGQSGKECQRQQEVVALTGEPLPHAVTPAEAKVAMSL